MGYFSMSVLNKPHRLGRNRPVKGLWLWRRPRFWAKSNRSRAFNPPKDGLVFNEGFFCQKKCEIDMSMIELQVPDSSSYRFSTFKCGCWHIGSIANHMKNTISSLIFWSWLSSLQSIPPKRVLFRKVISPQNASKKSGFGCILSWPRIFNNEVGRPSTTMWHRFSLGWQKEQS